MIKKPAVSIRANRLEFNMSAIRLFEGVQYILPILFHLGLSDVPVPGDNTQALS